MRGFSLLLTGAVCLTVTSLARADEVRLKSGRVLVGETKVVGASLHVRTTDGWVVVPREDVTRIRTDDDLRAEWELLAARAGNSVHARLGLARAARDVGLHAEMWDMVEAAVRERVPGSAGDRRLRSFLGELEPLVLPPGWRDDRTEVRVQQLLLRLQPDTREGIAAAVAVLLAAVPDADAELRERARSASHPAQRVGAVSALANRPAEGNDRFVYRTAIVDRSVDVRSATAAMLRDAAQTAAAVSYLAPGLQHESPLVRIRTAGAFEQLADETAVELLVAAGPNAGTPPSDSSGGSVRGHVAFLQQQSYIQDFDVEVAQASFIADPKVNVLQSGAVLDTTVHSVITFRTQIVAAYRNALRRIAGSDPGADPGTWSAWLERRRGQHALGQPTETR